MTNPHSVQKGHSAAQAITPTGVGAGLSQIQDVPGLQNGFKSRIDEFMVTDLK